MCAQSRCQARGQSETGFKKNVLYTEPYAIMLEWDYF